MTVPATRLGFHVKSVGKFALIPQSHRPNRHKTDAKTAKTIKFGERSVCGRYWFGLSVWDRSAFGQSYLSGINLSNIFDWFLPDKWSVVYRLYVGVMSGSVRGPVGLNSATDGTWFVGLVPQSHRSNRHETDKTRKIFNESTSCRPPTLLLKTPLNQSGSCRGHFG